MNCHPIAPRHRNRSTLLEAWSDSVRPTECFLRQCRRNHCRYCRLAPRYVATCALASVRALVLNTNTAAGELRIVQTSVRVHAPVIIQRGTKLTSATAAWLYIVQPAPCPGMFFPRGYVVPGSNTNCGPRIAFRICPRLTILTGGTKYSESNFQVTAAQA